MTNNSNRRRYPILILLSAGILATIILNLSQRWTREQIAANQAAHALALVSTVLPDSGYDNDPTSDVILLSDAALPGSSNPLPAYRARLGNTLVATAMTVIAADGYVGPIHLLIGIDAAGHIIRVRVIQHRETPGLGDKIEADKDDWINLFDGATALADPAAAEWNVRRDGGGIDQLSGATITSRAVLNAVRKTQRYYLANAATITAPAATTAD
jgi:electron transport complex protein RnfG